MASYTYAVFNSLGNVNGFNATGNFVGTSSANHGYLNNKGVITYIEWPGAIHTFPVVVNDFGTAAGFFITRSSAGGGFIFQNGIFSELLLPDATQIQPHAINNSEEIVGTFYDGITNYGFSIINGVGSVIEPLGSTSSSVFAVNDLGGLVGTYADMNLVEHGFTDINGVFERFDIQNSTAIFPKSINDSGEVVGVYADGSGQLHGFIDLHGPIQTLDPFGSTSADNLVVNNFGEIVGSFTDSTGDHGFTDIRGVIKTFNMPNAVNTYLRAVNDEGKVSGYYIDSDGIEHLFTASPTFIPNLTNDRNHIDANHLLKVDAQHGVLANDINHLPNESLWVVAVNGSTIAVDKTLNGHFGALTLNWDGSYSYKAVNQQILPRDSIGVDSFSYTVSNGDGATSTATLSIVAIHNDPKYFGGQANTLINGPNLQHTVLDGGAGGDTLNAGNKGAVLIGGHDDILKGGNGSDIFVFSGQFGSNTVKNFDANHDLMQFDRSFYLSIADVQSHAHQVGADTVIDGLGTNDVTLTGVKLASLHFDTSHMLLV